MFVPDDGVRLGSLVFRSLEYALNTTSFLVYATESVSVTLESSRIRRILRYVFVYCSDYKLM